VGSSHHVMPHPWVENGGDGPQIWRIAENISNNQAETADNWWSSSLWIMPGTNNSSSLNLARYEMLQWVID